MTSAIAESNNKKDSVLDDHIEEEKKNRRCHFCIYTCENCLYVIIQSVFTRHGEGMKKHRSCTNNPLICALLHILQLKHRHGIWIKKRSIKTFISQLQL